MKWINISLIFFATLSAAAQTTATNFNASDCGGTNHYLFSELDAGKVVVLIWVMPCGTCINGALTAQTEVQTALASNPGRVLYYVADDYANTSCKSLNTWCTTNGVTDGTTFSSASIKMSDYGLDGMPKVVVLAGTDHKIYYNQNHPDITGAGIQNAISQALAATATITGVNKSSGNSGELRVFPNPAGAGVVLHLNLSNPANVSVEVRDLTGRTVLRLADTGMIRGEQELLIPTAGLVPGNYILNVADHAGSRNEKLIIAP